MEYELTDSGGIVVVILYRLGQLFVKVLVNSHYVLEVNEEHPEHFLIQESFDFPHHKSDNYLTILEIVLLCFLQLHNNELPLFFSFHLLSELFPE